MDNTQQQQKQEEVQDFLLQLREPFSFKQLQEHFDDVESELLKKVVDELHHQTKLNVISMFLSNKVKCNSVRIEYVEIEKHHLDTDEQSLPEVAASTEKPLKSDDKPAVFEYKKHEDLNDEQLLEYKKELIAQKTATEEKKKSLNTKSDRLKRIQDRNEMKDIAGSIFQRIATIRNITTKEVFQEYDLDNNEK